MKNHTDLMLYRTIEERFEYLSLGSTVGDSTFGFERFLNQDFYRSYEWKQIRKVVIARDNGFDLGVEGYPVVTNIIIHHMNPMTIQQIQNGNEIIVDPEYLISCSLRTHNAIHYGDVSLLPKLPVVRTIGDTRLW